MRSEAKRALQLPRLLNDFKRYQLNIWTDQDTLWLPMDYIDDEGNHYGWDHCTGSTPWQKLEEKLKGKRCFGGMDLSARSDLSALVWYFPVQPGLEKLGIYSRGRFGAWKYEVSNQDHSLMQGVELANHLIKGVPETTLPFPEIANANKFKAATASGSKT